MRLKAGPLLLHIYPIGRRLLLLSCAIAVPWLSETHGLSAAPKLVTLRVTVTPGENPLRPTTRSSMGGVVSELRPALVQEAAAPPGKLDCDLSSCVIVFPVSCRRLGLFTTTTYTFVVC